MSDIFLKRKHTRLKEYDYRTSGIYFITICTHNRNQILSNIVCSEENDNIAEVVLTPYGEIAEEQLLLLEERYSNLSIVQYVIMPDHIHVIIWLSSGDNITIANIIGTYKSLTTRFCKALHPLNKIFQTSYYDHIIRNDCDYNEISKYISENPMRWYYKHHL